ncbi:hypothetical protein FPV67DRAFT_624457 [Lyophyllum atratum]|nr:hypothetical protein FPV67DRAFT_624457 [Lyophyllum atratum]
MFPVNDLNLVVCGIATFAATVGYACSRKLTSEPRHTSGHLNSTTILPSKAQGASEQDKIAEDEDKIHTAPGSLKRKRAHDDHDEISADAGYPHNLSLIYPPKKRSRTPSSENDSEEAVAEKSLPSPPAEKSEDPAATPASTAGESLEATPPPSTPEQAPSIISEALSTPSHVFGSPATISTSIPRSPLGSSQRIATSSAFSTFAGSASPFSRVTPASKANKPAWLVASPDALKSPNDEASDATSDDADGLATSPQPDRHVLLAAVTSKSTFEHVTGEEDEDVELELKGVKLFVKRGDKPFSDGMVGHVKLLSNRTTLDERLLFRREPLWQVSMNVRMHPTIRCTFDAKENILRVILREAVVQKDASAQDAKREVTIYVLKPGRSCSKQDFKDFAISLTESRSLKTQ